MLSLSPTCTYAAINSTAQALNTTETNLVPQAPGGPTLYYNGSGPVPAYTEVTPDPIPITPLNRSTIIPPAESRASETDSCYSTSALENVFYTELFAIANGTSFPDNCSQCLAGAEVMHLAAVTLPVPNFVDLAIRMCVGSFTS